MWAKLSEYMVIKIGVVRAVTVVMLATPDCI